MVLNKLSAEGDSSKEAYEEFKTEVLNSVKAIMRKYGGNNYKVKFYLYRFSNFSSIHIISLQVYEVSC